MVATLVFKPKILGRVASKEKLLQAVRAFEADDEKTLGRLMLEAYKRWKFKPIQDKWFRFEQGKRMACPLAMLIADCFPSLEWTVWNDMEASSQASMLAVDSFGLDAVEGFADAMDRLSIDYARTENYRRGYRMGALAWVEVVAILKK
jgi:hypothetical protein